MKGLPSGKITIYVVHLEFRKFIWLCRRSISLSGFRQSVRFSTLPPECLHILLAVQTSCLDRLLQVFRICFQVPRMSARLSRLSIWVLIQSVGLAVWTVILVFQPYRCFACLFGCFSQFSYLNYLPGRLDNFCECHDCMPKCHKNLPSYLDYRAFVTFYIDK